MTQPQHDHDDSFDQAILEQTGDAIRATEHSDDLYDALNLRLSAIRNCPITVVEAHGIALQSIKDTGSDDPDSSAWNQYEADAESVLNHALYRRGRPGECGPNCPALSNT